MKIVAYETYIDGEKTDVLGASRLTIKTSLRLLCLNGN
jgi:hypothetical protein